MAAAGIECDAVLTLQVQGRTQAKERGLLGKHGDVLGA